MAESIHWGDSTEVLILDDNSVLMSRQGVSFLINEVGVGVISKLISSEQPFEGGDFYSEYFLKNGFAVKQKGNAGCSYKDSIAGFISGLFLSELEVFFLDGFIPASNELLGVEEKDSLLVRFYNNTVSIGPLLSRDGACVNCIAHRLKWNNPIHSLNEKIDSSVLAGDIGFKCDDIDWLIQEVNSCYLNDGLLSDSYYLNFDTSKKMVIKHPVVKRPQCSLCGDPEIFTKQSLRPLVISEDVYADSLDGGVRVISPTETINNILPFVSAESGLITYVTPDDATDNSNNYRCVFHKSPYCSNELKNIDLVQVTVGKGISSKQSKASAMGEAIERLAANYSGEEPCFFSEPDLLESRYYLPEELSPFSQLQFEKFSENKECEAYKLYSTTPYRGEKMHWSPVWSLTNGDKVYLPSNYCFDNTPYVSETFSRYYQNGCSAGNVLSEAVLQGMFEVVERDAIAIWWYNKIEREQVSYSNIDSLIEFVDQRINSEEWEHWVLDIQHDFEIPVFAAIGKRKSDGCFSLGFGCHISEEIAIKRAVTELSQMISVMVDNCAPFDFYSIKDESYLYPSENIRDVASTGYELGLSESINLIIQKARCLGLEVLALNTSRADFPLKTVKVVIPGMCHMFPFLAADRLYNVPVKIGFLENKKSEKELNELELLI